MTVAQTDAAKTPDGGWTLIGPAGAEPHRVDHVTFLCVPKEVAP